METKHTQGEWAITEQSNYQFAITSQNHAICFIPKASPNVEANAKLIANAPLMLEALLKIQSRTDLFPFINEVIQKATN